MNRPHRTLRRLASIGAAFALACGAVLVGAAPAQAATYTVTNLTDADPGSLRAAIIQANSNPGPDSIAFQAGLGGGVNPIVVTSGPITITGPLTISGPGPENLSIVRDGNFDLFETDFVEAGGLTIEGLDFIGNTDTGSGLYVPDETIDVSNITLRNTTWGGFLNTAEGGAIAIFTATGTLLVADSVFASNSAAYGGAIYADGVAGAVTFTNVLFEGNASQDDGGAVWIGDPDGVQVTGSTFDINQAGGRGGGLFIEGISDMSLIELTNFTGNSANLDPGGSGYGGAIYVDYVGFDVTLTIRQSAILDSELTEGEPAAWGAGLYVDEIAGDVLIDSSTFARGQFVDAQGDPAGGAGLSIAICEIAAVGALTIIDSTFDEGVELDSYDIHACGVAGAINILYSTLVGPGILYIENSDAEGEVGSFITSSILNASTFPAVNIDTGDPVYVEWSLSSTPDDSSIDNGEGNRYNVANFLLGPLQNNGGPTPTRLLLPGSPALDSGNPGVSGQPTWDQRGPGYPRVNGRIDIGAIEMPRTLPPTGEPLPTAAGFAGILLLLVGAGLVIRRRHTGLVHPSA